MEFGVILVLAVFLIALIQGIGQWIENENSPVLTESAVIADRRRRTHHHHSNGHHHHSHSYHVTFLLENGENMELRVRRWEYDSMKAGDKGMLTHQGTRFLGFEQKGEEDV